MSLTVGELNAKLSLDKSAFDRDLDSSEGKFGKFAGGVGKLAAGAGLVAGAAFAGAAVKGIASFANLEKGMNEVFTLLPGISDSAMKDMTGQVKDFAKEFGVLPDEVVPALYQSISAGVPADNVFDFLEVAQKAAKGGVTDLTTAVDGISSVVNAYGDDVISAAEASDLMFTAVRLGKTNFEEMSNSLFQVIPTASALGVEFGDVTAALAAMTAQGTPTSVATTQLRQLLVELSKDGGKASDAFKEIAGEGFQDFVAGGGDVYEALKIMQQGAEENDVALQDMFGSVEAGAAALSLTGSEAFADNLGEMANAAGATEAANEQMSQGLTDSFNKIKAAVAVGTAEFGEKLAPTVAKVIDFVLENWPLVSAKIQEVMEAIQAVVGPVLEWLVEFWAEHGEAIVAGVTQFQEQVMAIFQAAADFINAVVERVTIIVSAIWEAHGEKIMKVVSAAWGFIQRTIGNVLDVIKGIFKVFASIFRGDWAGLWEALKGIFLTLWDQIKNILGFAFEALGLVFELALDGLKVAWEFVWTHIKDFASGIWDGIKSLIKGNINTIIGWIEGFVNSLIRGINKASSLLSKLPGVNIAQVGEISLPRLHRGGTVPGVPGSEMFAVLQAGERVVDSGTSVLPGGSAGGGGMIQVTTPTKEAREIAREIAWVQEFEMRVATA